ncbi:diguanylate cyclase [Petroclostridium sp. X23]|uniref:diguanylate cyclase n=1 Tax=Petroclostridium sp. X23 TaxID=3045146 RepID=UPI0024ACEDF4|nr:diguanylate cyclase [Petroclostridium sp. X23]WHH61112.1 diguanylate cyclase [Petroclostridium sp. X23]
MARNNFKVKFYLFFISITLFIPVSAIFLIWKNSMLPPEQKSDTGMLTIVVFILFLAYISILCLLTIILRIYKKVKELQYMVSHTNQREHISFGTSANIVNIFSEFERICGGIKILRFENQILYDTALAIHTSATLQELLDTILARLTTHMHADFGLMFLLEGDLLQLEAQFNIKEQVIKKTSFRIGEGLVGWVAHKGIGILSNDVENDQRYILCIQKTRSQMTIPIKIYEKILGVLVLGSENTNCFKKSDFKLVDTISGEIGLAINNAKLTQKLKNESKNNQLLYKMTREITSSVKLDNVAKIGIKAITDIVDVHTCIISIYDVQKNALDIIASNKEDDETEKHLKLEGVIKQAILERHPIKKNTDDGCRYAVPLLSEDQCIGMIDITSKTDLSKDEFELINNIMAPLSTALENALLYRSVKNLASKDGLTGLYNHRSFQQILEKEIESAKRNDCDLSLVMLDIDNFKKYNDIYGHQAGDYILKELADILQNNLRPEDIVSRYGGDEISIILPGATVDEAGTVMERVRIIVSDHKFEIVKFPQNIDESDDEDSVEKRDILKINLKNMSLSQRYSQIRSNVAQWLSDKGVLSKSGFSRVSLDITISIGVCSLKDVDYNKEELVQNADEALILAKRQGKNKVKVWEPLKRPRI